MRFLLLLLAAASASAFARTLHVDASSGNDSRDGLAKESALRTIQRAADLVQAGDTVVIQPGIYFEQVRLSGDKRGRPEAPIVFRADRIRPDRVILSGASPDLRRGRTQWELVDAATGLYAAPFSGPAPSRVTYNHVDLYPYASRQALNTFTTGWEGGSPGPRHGFHHDTDSKKLFVRLHADGLYGPADPNKHAMAVSPPRTRGRGFSILGTGPAHVVIEGITFETPGDSAIYTEASVVTVRDSWFYGCPYAVRGTNQGKALEPGVALYDTASEIVIEHCEFTEHSTYNDASELLAAAGLKSGERAPWSAIWHRKTMGRYGLPPDTKNYENGLAVRIGRGWIIRHNYIHDIFEGLANDGMGNALDVRIHDNVFARICDNAIETENHSRNVHIYRNLILDVFEPLSYQPLGGPPWPGPLYFYQNVVANTPEHATTWLLAPHGGRGLFKLGISLKNWSEEKNSSVPRSPLNAPAPGLLFFNNTLYFPGGRFVTLLGSRDVPIGNVRFEHNLIATDFVFSRDQELPEGFFTFRNNLAAPATAGQPGPGIRLAGTGGRAFPGVDALGWLNPAGQDFRIRTDSPARGAGGEVDASPVGPFTNAGALQDGDTWFPPKAGPRVN